jgi:hypothetical protein
MPTVTLIGQAILMIGGALLVMVCFLALILYLGATKSRVLSLDLAQRLNIEVCRSMAHTTAELYWLHMLLQELHITLSTAPSLWCDNVSAIALASNPVFHSRTKHIEINYPFVREKVVNHDIQIQHTSTQDQIADVFTKSHNANRFCFLRDNLCVCLLPHSLRGGVRVLNSITTSTKSGTESSIGERPEEDQKKMNKDNML